MDIQAELLAYIEEQRSKQLAVGHNQIQQKARKLAKEAGITGVTFSNGWVTKFVKRNHLSFRSKTHVGQKLPEMLIERITNFFLYLRRKQKLLKITNEDILGMDETVR